MTYTYNPVPKPETKSIKIGRYWYVTVPCDSCGEQLHRRKDQVNQRGTGTYCKPCANKKNGERMQGNTINKRNRKPVTCKQCGKDFEYFNYKIGIRKFCSKKCSNEHFRDNMPAQKFISTTLSGKDNPRYKHGRRIGKRGDSKPKVRNGVIERDGGNWCLFCGLPGPGLHLHRVIYGSQCGKYEVSNCVQLCGEHHGLVHSSKKTWQPLLLDHLNNPKERNWKEIMDTTADGIKFKRQLREKDAG